MVRLKLTAHAISEREYNSLDTNGRPKLFREIVQEPESVTVGWLVNKLRHRYLGMFRQELPAIKYIKDADDVDLDVEMTVFDALMNEGAAKKDGLDQQAVIKLIFEGGLGIREGTIIPDLSLAKFKFAPSTLASTIIPSDQTSFRRSNATSQRIPQDRPVPSIESDTNHHSHPILQGRGKGSPMVIQDSQVAFEDGKENAREKGDALEEEPKSESPELARGPFSFPLPRSKEPQPTTNEPVLGPNSDPSAVVRVDSEESERLIAPSIHFLHVENEPSQRSPVANVRSISKSTSSGLRSHPQRKLGERHTGSVPITPPSDTARDRAVGTRSTNSKLSRPSCRISPAKLTSQNDRPSPPQTRSNNAVYDVPESEIEDSQIGPMVPSTKKRKMASSNRSSSTNFRPSKRTDSRPAPHLREQPRPHPVNDSLFGRLTEKPDRNLTAEDHDRTVNAPASDKSNAEEGSAYSEEVTGRDEIDQQLLESTNAVTADRYDSDKPVCSEDGGEAETLIHEDLEGDAESSRQNDLSLVADSGSKHAGDNAHDIVPNPKDSERHDPDSDSEKENVNVGAGRNTRIAYHGQSIESRSRSSSGSIEKSAAVNNSIEYNLDAAPSKAPDPRSVKQRTALGILKDISLDRDSQAKDTERDEDSMNQESADNTNFDGELKGATSTSGDGKVSERITKGQGYSILDELIADATDAQRLELQIDSSKSTSPAAEAEILHRRDECIGISKSPSELRQNGSSVSKKRKRQLGQEDNQAPGASIAADPIATDTLGLGSDAIDSAAKQRKKARKIVRNNAGVNSTVEDHNGTLKPASSTARHKKKAHPVVEKEIKASNDQTVSKSKTDGPIKKKKKNSPSNTYAVSADMALEPEISASKQTPASTEDSDSPAPRQSENVRRMGLGITSSPSHHRTKSLDPSISTLEPVFSAHPLLKKKKSSTALIPSGKNQGALEFKSTDSSRKILQKKKSGDATHKVQGSNSNGVEHSSKAQVSEQQLQRTETASPAPIIPVGMSEETWRKMVSKNADNTAVPSQSKKRTLATLDREPSKESTINEIGQRDEGASNSRVGATATKKRESKQGKTKAQSSIDQTTLEAEEDVDHSLTAPNRSLKRLRADNVSKKDVKKTVSKDKITMPKDKAKPSVELRTTDPDQSNSSNELDQVPSAATETPNLQLKKAKSGVMLNATISPTIMNKSDDTHQVAPSSKLGIGRRDQIDSESESQQVGSAFSKASKSQAKANEKFSRDSTKPSLLRSMPAAEQENSKIKSGASDTPSAAEVSKNKIPTSKSANGVSHSRLATSSSTQKPASDTGLGAPPSKKAAKVKENAPSIDEAKNHPTAQQNNARTETPQQFGASRLASMRRKQEEAKAASLAAARKAEAERQCARLTNAQESTTSSSSDSSDSSDESASDSNAAPPKRLFNIASSSAKPSLAHLDYGGADSGVKKPFQTPTSVSSTHAGRDTSSDSGSDESDDDTEIVKRDQTPPPKKGAPKGLIEGLKKAWGARVK